MLGWVRWDGSWGMTLRDEVLSEAVILDLAHRVRVAAKHVTFVDESGRKGRAYVLDDQVILKTHRPQRLRGRLLEEFETSVEKGGLLSPPAGHGSLAASSSVSSATDA